MKYLITAILSLWFLFGSILPVHAANIDVYLVYTKDDRRASKTIKMILNKSMKVKTYNASLLTMADYSGKQKVVARISGAKVVVWVSSDAKKLLGHPDLPHEILLTEAGELGIEQIKMAVAK